MPEHVTEWLSAYLDGELRGSRLHQVEGHLAGCRICQTELQALQGLSALLREVPSPDLTSPERFTAQINLRLPRQLPKGTKRRVQDVGWWMIPVSLLAVWIFMSTVGLVSDVVSTANEFGLLKSAPGWLVSGSSAGAYWSGALGQFGVLSGSSLEWVQMTEAFTRNTLPQIVWQVSIAMSYLGWIAIWWARHTRQGHGRPLEG